MGVAALGLVLGAAVAHAAWNLLAKRAGGGAAFVWLVEVAAAGLYLPVALAVVLWTRPTLDPDRSVPRRSSARGGPCRPEAARGGGGGGRSDRAGARLTYPSRTFRARRPRMM